MRYYDEIGLLKPLRINSSKYRIYGQKQVDLLQQIMFYRELGMTLEDIKKIISSSEFNELHALNKHYQKLLDKRKQIDLLINNIEKTIAEKEGKGKMSNKEKFEGFKQKMVKDNEQKYGQEVRKKYGDKVANESNQKILNMSEEQYEKLQKVQTEMIETLKAAHKTKDPAGELAQKAVLLHKEWLLFFWKNYSLEAHAGLAKMYVEDERFKAHYDNIEAGLAEFFKDAIYIYTKQ